MTERARGKIITLKHFKEGTIESFDGTRIWYRSIGKSSAGAPTILCCNGLGVGTFFWTYLERYFRGNYRVVTWDYRGHGKSELKKNPRTYNLASLVKDGKAVLDGLGIKEAVFVGHSLGVQLALEFYRYWPERVASMILCFGTYGRPMDNFYNTRLSKYFFDLVYQFAMQFPSQSSRISHFLLDNPLSFWMGGIFKMMHTGMMKKDDATKYIKHVLSVDPTYFTMLLKSLQDHSAEDMLPQISCPSLVIGGELDQFTPVWLSKKMSRLIPDAELFLINNATHAGLVEQADLINLRIEKFMRERLRTRSKKSAKIVAEKVKAVASPKVQVAQSPKSAKSKIQPQKSQKVSGKNNRSRLRLIANAY